MLLQANYCQVLILKVSQQGETHSNKLASESQLINTSLAEKRYSADEANPLEPLKVCQALKSLLSGTLCDTSSVLCLGTLC